MDLTRAEVENALKKRGYLATEPQALDVICRAAHAWLTLEARVRELEAAGQAFLKRYDELMPYIVNDRHICLIHGVPWNHGNWQQEVDKLRELCQRKEETQG